MKKFIIPFLLLIVLIHANATVYTVNIHLETDIGKKIYSSLQAAHDAASANDTIYVERYNIVDDNSTITISKPLYIIGPGYFPGENPSVQVNRNIVEIYDMELSSGAVGTKLEGLEVYYNVGLYANDITITHCNLGIDVEEDVDNLSITKTYLDELDAYYNIINNLMVSNCLIQDDFQLDEGTSGIVINNTFGFANSTYAYVIIPTGITFKNNIVKAGDSHGASLPTLPDAYISHNLSTKDFFGTDNNNQSNVDENNLFIGYENGSTDGQFKLKTGSPAIGAGEGGVDLGAFGGPDPYVLSGVPSIPVIYELDVSGFSNDENKLPVSFKAKSR